MSDVDFTMLGMTGSGKTCFLTGMYYEMSSGIQGYTLSSDDDIDIELRNKWEKLCDEKNGVNRFPVGTDKTEQYKFTLEYAYESIKEFNWLDYPGGDLEKKSTGNIDSYKEIEEAILKSTCLFICVDGSLLCEKNKEVMIENIRNKCSSKINGFLSKYQKKNHFLPPVSIVITKYDMCREVKGEIMEEVIKESFSSLFPENHDKNKIVTIIPVSIGRNISDDNYSGRLEPINIYVPLFWGIWFSLKKDLKSYKMTEDNLKERIVITKKEIENIKNKFVFFGRKKKINLLTNNLNEKKGDLSKIQLLLKKQTEYVERIYAQLKEIDVYIGGDKLHMDNIEI